MYNPWWKPNTLRQSGGNPIIRIANRPIFIWIGLVRGLDQKFDFLKCEDFETRYKDNTTFLKVL